MRRIFRSSAVTAIGLSLLSVSLSAPAYAVLWKSAEDPLYVYEDGVKQGKAYGNFYNDGSVSAMSTSWQYDMKPGGNNVRVETDFYFWEEKCGTPGNYVFCYNFDVSKQTDETNTASWFKDSRARNLHAEADKVRGAINICEIQAFHNDPCSAHAYPTFSY